MSVEAGIAEVEVLNSASNIVLKVAKSLIVDAAILKSGGGDGYAIVEDLRSARGEIERAINTIQLLG